MPDMIIQHLNFKAERKGLSRGDYDPSIGPDNIDDRDDEEYTSSNLHISSDSGVRTPLLSLKQTPVA